ncbi:MAG: hypothetical protein EOO42_13740 [Flavobacteriales bacterium]|nr:MAG: hypothetical protein EOO42_13740 [Flavobacteriales bacterium]
MKEKILKKIELLIGEATALREISLNLDNAPDYGDITDQANEALEISFHTFRISTLSFLEISIGDKHLYYNDFRNKVNQAETYNIDYSIALLEKLSKDIEDGWLLDLKTLVSAEIFNDFLEMAQHLMEEGYKDAAAVIIGSVLEENIRQVCINNNVSISIKDKSNKLTPKRASIMNDDLYKAQVYNLNVQKAIVGWLAIRNSAAHGKYHEYDFEQVASLLSSVRDFAAKYLS